MNHSHDAEESQLNQLLNDPKMEMCVTNIS